MRINEKVERSNQKITAHGGTLLLRKLEEDLNLKQRLDIRIRDKWPRSYKPADIILPIVLMLHTGGRYLEDIARMAEDKTLCALHQLYRIPDPTTVSRWCNTHGTDRSGTANHPDKPDSASLRALDNILISLAKKSIRKSGERDITIDIDWTGIKANKQESNRTYKGFKGMASLTAFIGETGACAGSWFRNGNISPLSDIKPMLAHIVSNLEGNGDIHVKRFRSDSAGYQAEVINFCEDHNIRYGIRARMDNAVVKTISAIKEKDWHPLIGRDGHEIPGHKVTSTVHTMTGTKKSFRLVVIRKEKDYPEKKNTETADDILDTPHFSHFATATNSELPDSLLIRFYNNRGTCEQYIREAKYGFSLNYLPMSTLNGNAVWSAVGMLAYNLGVLLKQMVLDIHPLSMRIQTVRYRFYQVPAKLVNHAGKLVVKLFCSRKRFAVFREALAGWPSP